MSTSDAAAFNPVKLEITFTWICPGCSKENFVPRNLLEFAKEATTTSKNAIPLLPTCVECVHCQAKWNTL